MIRKSRKSKMKEGRGLGEGADYKPYIQAREFNSSGTCSNPIDWKTGRTMELLSQGEAALWHILRWNDDYLDIREQYPLIREETLALAEYYGIAHPGGEENVMTTDFLVTLASGELVAYSMKSSRSVMNSRRQIEKAFLEKAYWTQKNIEFRFTYKDELNLTLAQNIRSVVSYYDLQKVHDITSLLKYFISHKRLVVDMQHTPLDFEALLEDKEIASMLLQEGNQNGLLRD